jgi:hypothetical protein
MPRAETQTLAVRKMTETHRSGIIIITFTWSGTQGVAGYTEAQAFASLPELIANKITKTINDMRRQLPITVINKAQFELLDKWEEVQFCEDCICPDQAAPKMSCNH